MEKEQVREGEKVQRLHVLSGQVAQDHEMKRTLVKAVEDGNVERRQESRRLNELFASFLVLSAMTCNNPDAMQLAQRMYDSITAEREPPAAALPAAAPPAQAPPQRSAINFLLNDA